MKATRTINTTLLLEFNDHDLPTLKALSKCRPEIVSDPVMLNKVVITVPQNEEAHLLYKFIQHLASSLRT